MPVIVRWPKKTRPIPLEAIPGAKLATQLIELTRQAHLEELENERRKVRRAQHTIRYLAYSLRSRKP